MSIEVAQMDAVGRLGVAIKRIAQKDAEIERLQEIIMAANGELYAEKGEHHARSELGRAMAAVEQRARK